MTSNPRVKRTKTYLKEALIELLDSEDFDKVTVKSICEKAAVNRSTFYAYYSCPRDLIDDEDVKLMLLLLAESIASRMRELASRCTVVEIFVRDTELNSFFRQKKLRIPSCSSQELAQVGMDLFRRHYRWERPIRSIGLRGAGLVECQSDVQLSMFAEDGKRDKWERIDCAVDRLRTRYGYLCIRRALLDCDPLLGHMNVHDDHTVHPVGYFQGR